MDSPAFTMLNGNPELPESTGKQNNYYLSIYMNKTFKL